MPPSLPSLPDPEYWLPRRLPNGQFVYTCIVCRDGRERPPHHTARHEKSDTHKCSLAAFPDLEHQETSTLTPPNPTDASSRILTDDALRQLLSSLTSGNVPQPAYLPSSSNDYGEPNFEHAPQLPALQSRTNINWLSLSGNGNMIAENTPYDQMCDYLARKGLDIMNGGVPGEVHEDWPDSDTSSNCEESLPGNGEEFRPSKRARLDTKNILENAEWYPWQDRITCTLDVLMHLPRSVFSRKQLDLFLWLLRTNNVDAVPTTKTMTHLNKILQSMCGIDTLAYDGRQGHRYHVNNLGQILAQEMSNPKVRLHLHFYPEETSPHLRETRQAARWLHEVREEDTTPMVRVKHSDYYLYEPVLLNNHTVCMPHRWFTRDSVFYGKAWLIEATMGDDGIPGWVVRQDCDIEIHEGELHKSLPELSKVYVSDRVDFKWGA